jgi:hypothetical protein
MEAVKTISSIEWPACDDLFNSNLLGDGRGCYEIIFVEYVYDYQNRYAYYGESQKQEPGIARFQGRFFKSWQAGDKEPGFDKNQKAIKEISQSYAQSPSANDIQRIMIAIINACIRYQDGPNQDGKKTQPVSEKRSGKGQDKEGVGGV